MAEQVESVLELSGAERTRLETLLLDFDRGWSDERLTAAARELLIEDPLRRPALVGMVQIDLEKQWKAKRRPIVEEYLTRFSELCAVGGVPVELLQAEYDVRRQFNDKPSLIHYSRRFPAQADALRRLLERRQESDSLDCAVSTFPTSKRASTDGGAPAADVSQQLPTEFSTASTASSPRPRTPNCAVCTTTRATSWAGLTCRKRCSLRPREPGDRPFATSPRRWSLGLHRTNTLTGS